MTETPETNDHNDNQDSQPHADRGDDSRGAGPRRRGRGRPDGIREGFRSEGPRSDGPRGEGLRGEGHRGEGMPPRGRGHRRGFIDGPQRPHRARRGDVRSAVLSLLSQEPQNGYRLMKSFRDATDGAWRPSPGSIYPTLTQLVDEGLIVSVGEGRHTEFELTENGRAHVAEHADELDKAWASATGQSAEDLAFSDSVAKLTGAIDQFRLAASEEQRTAGGKAIDDARRALYLILAE